MSAVIALVDDDRNILTSVSMALEVEGFCVHSYSDGEQALVGLQHNSVDLVVLDIKMPRLDGFALLTALRHSSDIPVIFLTSRDDKSDQIQGLRLGADDYIAKPFSVDLLIARIRAVLRRKPGHLASYSSNMVSNITESRNLIRFGALQLDPVTHRCLWDGILVSLTLTEFLILQRLVRYPGQAQSRVLLIQAAYDKKSEIDERKIDSHIKRLRRKFQNIDAKFDVIETLYGIGYRYRI